MPPVKFLVNVRRNNDCGVTRKFYVDDNVAMDCKLLYEKIETLFSDLRGKNFILGWTDVDKGDDVTLIINDGSNSELKTAVEKMIAKNGMCEFYIIIE